MALIPSDVGLRLRLDNELLTQPVPPVQEIAADIPRLQAGQIFSAQIRDVLPGNTYLALVAGKTVTLSLPDTAKSGDVLDLVVIEQTPKSIVAQLANPPVATGADAAAYQHTRLSRTAQMLSPLLTNEGETPSPATLNRGQPLLAQPPRSGAELVPVLSKAVTESGLFYEAHQAQWVAGKLPLRNLLQEPQGQHSVPTLQVALQSAAQSSEQATAHNPAAPPSLLNAIAGEEVATDMLPGEVPHPEQNAQASSKSPTSTTVPQTPATPEPALNKAISESLLLYQSNQAQGESLLGHQHPLQNQGAALPGNETAAAQAKENASSASPNASPPTTGNEATSLREGVAEAGRSQAAQAQQAAASSTTLPAIPDDLRALVQQQLDAAGTQRLLWHGEVWPGQTMQWQLEWQDRGSHNGDGEQAEPWTTKLKLTTPRLGEVEASLQLGVAGVRIGLTTPYQHIGADMRTGAADLENALAAAGVPLSGFSVKILEEPEG